MDVTGKTTFQVVFIISQANICSDFQFLRFGNVQQFEAREIYDKEQAFFYLMPNFSKVSRFRVDGNPAYHLKKKLTTASSLDCALCQSQQLFV